MSCGRTLPVCSGRRPKCAAALLILRRTVRPGHLTAGQILEEVRRSYPFIDASTVYRTLASAKDLRLVSETNLGAGDNLYEWSGTDHHHHMICRGCGQLSSLEERHLESLVATLERETGFHADLHHLAIFGLCAACAKTAS
jgi:Fur family ferric uptake transcriptional regulator